MIADRDQHERGDLPTGPCAAKLGAMPRPVVAIGEHQHVGRNVWRQVLRDVHLHVVGIVGGGEADDQPVGNVGVCAALTHGERPEVEGPSKLVHSGLLRDDSHPNTLRSAGQGRALAGLAAVARMKSW